MMRLIFLLIVFALGFGAGMMFSNQKKIKRLTQSLPEWIEPSVKPEYSPQDREKLDSILDTIEN